MRGGPYPGLAVRAARLAQRGAARAGARADCGHRDDAVPRRRDARLRRGLQLFAG